MVTSSNSTIWHICHIVIQHTILRVGLYFGSLHGRGTLVPATIVVSTWSRFSVRFTASAVMSYLQWILIFQQIDEDSPYELSPKEKEVVEKLVKSFKNSEKLQKHINFLYTKGSIYKIYNQNLLIHGCVPMNDLGELVEVEFENKKLKGKEYLDYIDEIARKAFYLDEGEEKTNAMDFMWYLWCGKYSPIFCKNAMKTFERYFLEDKNLRKEIKNPFYEFAQDEKVCKSILKEFGINKEEGRIIGGHMPVKLKDGESPIKANGKLLIIDGGLSKPYQKTKTT